MWKFHYTRKSRAKRVIVDGRKAKSSFFYEENPEKLFGTEGYVLVRTNLF